MEEILYIVEKIDGDYAHLKQIEQSEEESKIVARALLPETISEGTKLLYQWLEYTIV